MPDEDTAYGHYQHPLDYDLETAHITDDIPFWVEAARRFGAKMVLELACGTGRLAIPLAREGVKEGFSVVGLDINPEMLGRGREKLGQELEAVRGNLTLVEGDMRRFRVDDTFDLIILAFNSAFHLLEIEDQMAAFRSAYRHLRLGGRFMVDVFNPDLGLLAEAGQLGEKVELDVDAFSPEEGVRLLRYVTRKYFGYDQFAKNRFIHEKYWNGGRFEKRVSDYRLHIYFPRELRLLFMLTGYIVESVYGDYDWRPFGPGSRKMIFVGRKM